MKSPLLWGVLIGVALAAMLGPALTVPLDRLFSGRPSGQPAGGNGGESLLAALVG